MTDDTEPLLQAPLPQTQRRSGRKVGLVALALGSLLLLGLYLTLTARQRQREAPRPPAKPSAYEVTGTPDASATLEMQKDYTKRLQWNPEPPPPPKPVQAALPPPPVERPPPMPMFPSVMQAAPLLPPLPPAPAPLPPVLPPVQPPQKAVEVVQAPTPKEKEPKKPTSWMTGALHLAKPPFEAKDAPKEKGERKEEKAGGSLIHQAKWERSADPARVLYRSQTIQGILLHEVNSDLPGQVRIMVTRPVQDKFGQGVTLIDQHTIMLGEQQGKTSYGVSRLDVSIVELEYPDGTLVDLTKAKLTDKSGAVGGAGKVNNHLGQLGIAAILSTVLNVGSRSIAGNQSGFAPTLEQETARDIGTSINRSGQSIVDRELKVAPTITIAAGTPVAVQLQQNLSFSKPPKIVR